MQRTDETPNRKLSSNRNTKKTTKHRRGVKKSKTLEPGPGLPREACRALFLPNNGIHPTSTPAPIYQHSYGNKAPIAHSDTHQLKETQAPTSEKKPKPSLSLSAVRKVRPGKHEGGLRGQLRATDATTGATVGATSNDYRQYVLLPTCTTHENPSEQNPKKPSEHRRAAGRRF